MPTILKCPNPSCPYQFDAALVPVGAVVACPQCGFQFTLGPTPPTSGTSLTPPPGSDPLGGLDAPAKPKQSKVIDRSVIPTGSRSNASLLLALLAVGTVAMIAGGVVGVGFLLGWFGESDATAESGPATRFEEYAIAIGPPPDGWSRDEPTRVALGVNLLAFKRTDGEGWMAVEAKKFDYAAKASELRPRVYERLQRQFDELDEELTPEPETVLGQPGEKYQFRGVYKAGNVGCRGEVRACVAKNFAYWVYTWAPVNQYDALEPAFAQFRDDIALSAGPGPARFTPPKKPDKSFRTKSGLFALTDTEGLWAEKPDPTSQDAAAELWLRGNGKSAATGQPTGDAADLVVAVLDANGEAKAQARDHVLKQVIDGATVEEVEGDPTGDAPSGGEVKASDQITRLKLTYPDGPTANKLVVFATLDAGEKRVVAYALCPLRQANYWEQRLMLILGTLRPGK